MEWAAGRLPFAALLCAVAAGTGGAVVIVAGNGGAPSEAPRSAADRRAVPVLVPRAVALREVVAGEQAVERALAAPPVPLTTAERREALRVTRSFVATAVVREQLAASYDLVSDDYRRGFSRTRWATGDIPVQWLPSGTRITAHRFQASEGRLVWLLVRLVTPRESGLGTYDFTVSLAREPGAAARFRVDSFAPALRSIGAGGGSF